MNFYLISKSFIRNKLDISFKQANFLSSFNKPFIFNKCPKNSVFATQSRNESSTGVILSKTAAISPSETPTGSSSVGFISESPLTRFFEDFLCQTHDLLTLNWCATIFLAAFSFRLLVCFPIKIYQEHLIAKLINVQPRINELVKKKLKSTKILNEIGTSKLKSNKLEMILRNQVYKQEGCLPQKIPIASFLQLPFWMYLTGAVRNLTTGSFDHSIEMQEIRNESLLWINSLANCDPFYVIPLIYAIFAFGSIKYSSLNSVKNTNLNLMMSFRKYLTMTFICVITFLISKMPVSVGLFWIFSNSLSFVEIILLDSVLIRRFFRIPVTSLEHKNIYRFKYDLFKTQLENKQKWFNKKIFKK